MKKIFASLTLAAFLLCGVTAFAAPAHPASPVMKSKKKSKKKHKKSASKTTTMKPHN